MPKAPQILSSTPVRFADNAGGLERFFPLVDLHIRREDGSEDHHIIWRRGDFVVVVALTENGEIVVIEEHKMAANQSLWGLPAGAIRIKQGESAIDAGLRELTEETGYVGDPAKARMCGGVYNSPDKSTERHFTVVLWDVKKMGEPRSDATESILGTEEVPIGQLESYLHIALHLAAVALVERVDRVRWCRAIAMSEGIRYRPDLFGTIDTLDFKDCEVYLAANKEKWVYFRHESDGHCEPTRLEIESTEVVNEARGPWLVRGTLWYDINRPGTGESAEHVPLEVVIECWTYATLVYPAKGYTSPEIPDKT